MYVLYAASDGARRSSSSSQRVSSWRASREIAPPRMTDSIVFRQLARSGRRSVSVAIPSRARCVLAAHTATMCTSYESGAGFAAARGLTGLAVAGVDDGIVAAGVVDGGAVAAGAVAAGAVA